MIAIALLPGAALFFMHVFFINIGLYAWDGLPWFDIPMHLLGGAVTAWAVFAFFLDATRRPSIPKLPRWCILFMVVGGVALVGIIWEFAEFGVDVLRGSSLQGGLVDTMKDLFDDLVGGALTALILIRRSGTIFSRSYKKLRMPW